MRCLLFTDTINDVNGVARFVRALAAWSHAPGRELLIMSSSVKPVHREWSHESNIEVFPPRIRMTMPGYRDLDLAVPPIWDMLLSAREFAPECVHVSTPGPVGAVGAWIAGRLGVPLVGTWHTNLPKYIKQLTGSRALSEITSDALALFYQQFSLVLARSPVSLADVRSTGMARSKSFRPGVNLQSFSRRWKDREVWRNWGLDPDRAKVLYVGRVSVEKNVPMLIDALRDFPEADVVIVGDGPYRVQMQQGLPRAKFLGFQHGELLSTLYASSDLVVFPSTTDTLGQVALEAQASGVCVVVSNQGGPAHFVKHGVTGGIVSDQSPRAWNQSIRSLIADRDRLRAMGAAGAEWMKGFDIDASCAEFWQAHCDLLNQLRASRV